MLIPKASVITDKELLLNFRAEAKQTSVMFGTTTLSDIQNLGLLLDPVKCKNGQDKINVSYTTSKISITKLNKDTNEGVTGVTFKFETLDGKNS